MDLKEKDFCSNKILIAKQFFQLEEKQNEVEVNTMANILFAFQSNATYD